MTSPEVQVRTLWLSLMGMSQEEIDYQIEYDPPTNLLEEANHLCAWARICENFPGDNEDV